jgi:hypothetical protein
MNRVRELLKSIDRYHGTKYSLTLKLDTEVKFWGFRAPNQAITANPLMHRG